MNVGRPNPLFVAIALVFPIFCLSLVQALAEAPDERGGRKGGKLIGSSGCRECHEKFYRLWATSNHGLAMQPYTAQFGAQKLSRGSSAAPVKIGDCLYRPQIGPHDSFIEEAGPKGTKKYAIRYALGGKNVYYFLTPLESGRLQVLPLGYDVRLKQWFDVAGSGVRHFSDQPDHPIDWKDRLYTFNTSCHSCHVSQFQSNYNTADDSYRTTWSEPGINCETCHGPGEEHVRVCKAAPRGKIPKDLKIVRTGRSFTTAQNNETCAPCHAKTVPITSSFAPGERFFDHFDLAALEDPDFYPDGRDLGENYTYTLWRMSPCAKSGQLSCLHCHTSSGRYKFTANENANEACLPCHADRVAAAPAHTRHPANSEGNKCISCHMPMTEFARMRRSDHSMLPPLPAATLFFKSPNACNNCHRDKDAAWADRCVRSRQAPDFQEPYLYRAKLIDAARKRDWTRLNDMLGYIVSEDRDEIFATSLIRLLRACPDPSRGAAFLRAMKDSSPLVRAAAADALASLPSPEAAGGLLEAGADECRLVRIRAAMALSGMPAGLIPEAGHSRQEESEQELVASFLSHPDQWSSHYNLGNYYLNKMEFGKAVLAFEQAGKLNPGAVLPRVNSAIAYARLGDAEKAEGALNRALEIEPACAPAHFNLGLLKAERGDKSSAEKHLREALKSDPRLAAAAYNLSLLLSGDRLDEALSWGRKASELQPDEPRFAYALAILERKAGNEHDAVRILEELIRVRPAYGDSYVVLGTIYEGRQNWDAARRIYRMALANLNLSDESRVFLNTRLGSLP